VRLATFAPSAVVAVARTVAVAASVATNIDDYV